MAARRSVMGPGRDGTRGKRTVIETRASLWETDARSGDPGAPRKRAVFLLVIVRRQARQGSDCLTQLVESIGDVLDGILDLESEIEHLLPDLLATPAFVDDPHGALVQAEELVPQLG